MALLLHQKLRDKPLLRNNFHYEKPILSEIRPLLSGLQEAVKFFLFDVKGWPRDLNYKISGEALIDIIIRVDKRKAYFYFFHSLVINECKTVGLYAYWFLKLRPIQIYDKRFENNSTAESVNESFALHLLLFVLRGIGRLPSPIKGDEPYLKELLYSFRFRNISIDSMLVLADSINSETLLQGTEEK
jgi:hypothetical protein